MRLYTNRTESTNNNANMVIFPNIKRAQQYLELVESDLDNGSCFTDFSLCKCCKPDKFVLKIRMACLKIIHKSIVSKLCPRSFACLT